MSITDAITTAINFAALVFLGAQVMLARKALREAAEGQGREWDRQRRKATIDAIVTTAQYRESLKSTLPWNDRDLEAMAAFFEKVNGDHDRLAPVSGYLNHLDDLAVGVKQGVFDFETVSILEGNRLIDIAASYAPYIDSIRRELNRPTIWDDIDDLVELLKAARQGPITTAGEKTPGTPPLTWRGWLKLNPAAKRLRMATGVPASGDRGES